MNNLAIVTPIYKEALGTYERFSLHTSLSHTEQFDHYYIHPTKLNLKQFLEISESAETKSIFIEIDSQYFQSRDTYNQLMYLPAFYTLFQKYEYILILQTDALITNPKRLSEWLGSPFDYVGAPEDRKYSYHLPVEPFITLSDAYSPLIIQGLNGGLSLRRVKSFLKALSDYSDLANMFRNHANGIGEDIFFSIVGKVSLEFITPNEIRASQFAVTENFKFWIEALGCKPFGVHRWFTHEKDREIILKHFQPKISREIKN
jgi:hypothetical protein